MSVSSFSHVYFDFSQVVNQVPVPEQYTTVGAFTTVSFSSDGVNFCWFWCPGTVADKNIKSQTLNMDVCRIDVSAQKVAISEKSCEQFSFT